MQAALVLVFILIAFCCLAIGWAWSYVRSERRTLQKQTAPEQPKPPEQQHVHRWMDITEYAHQCMDPRCGVVEFKDSIRNIEGLETYILLMTTKQARDHPVREAELYRNLDPRMNAVNAGLTCATCFAVYPKFYTHCPYCDDKPEPSH
jgi:hypothetical protein